MLVGSGPITHFSGSMLISSSALSTFASCTAMMAITAILVPTCTREATVSGAETRNQMHFNPASLT